MVLSLVTRTQNKVAILLQWTGRDEDSKEEPENKNTRVGTKSLSGVIVGNYKEPKAKIVMRLNSNQAKEDSKKIETDQIVLDKSSTDKKVLNKLLCLSSLETRDQNFIEVKPVTYM
jgi:hypothetical protein